jgi:hypothetical protein
VAVAHALVEKRAGRAGWTGDHAENGGSATPGVAVVVQFVIEAPKDAAAWIEAQRTLPPPPIVVENGTER